MSGSASGVRLAIERASYPVAGSTAAGLRAVLHTLGPSRGGRTFAAFTDWEVAWSYAVEPSPEGARIACVRVDVRALVTVPRWRPLRSASAALVERWARYLAAVERHEQGHVDLAVEAGRGVLARFEGLPPFPEASQLAGAVTAVAQAEVAAARERERAYDQASNHGATQGATLGDEAGR